MTRRLSSKGMFSVFVCAAASFTTAACGPDDATSGPATSTVTASHSAPTSPADVTPPTDIDSTAELGKQPAPRGSAPDGSPIGLTEADANVNPADFATDGGGGQGYYFRSPSGNVHCGLGFDDVDIPAGCQAITSVPSSTGLTCEAGSESFYSGVFVSGAVISRCVNRPSYVGNPTAGQPPGTDGGRVLEYGQTISVRNTTCTSRTEGITCYGFGFGFTMARDRNEFF